jgi:hypothetical protein
MLIFTPFALCFVTLRGIFMRFPELTYWQDATVQVPCFLLFLCFRKAHKKYSRNWMKRRPKLLFFPEEGRGPKESRRGARGQPHHEGAWPSPWPRPPMVRTPWSPPNDAPSPIKSLPTENPKSIGVFPRTVSQHRRRRSKFRGTEVSIPAPCQDGEVPPEPSPSVSIASSAVSIDFTVISTNLAVSYDEEGVVLPRGWGLYR